MCLTHVVLLEIFNFFLFKVKGKGIFPDLKDVGSAVIGVGVGRIRRTIGAAVNGGRDNMRR